MATVEDLVDQGVLFSYATRPDSLALMSPELVSVVNREAHAMLHAGIRENPWHFALVAPLSYNSGQGGWVLPDHELVLRLELATASSGNTLGAVNDVIAVLPLDQRLGADDDLPKLYYLRGILVPSGMGMPATIDTTETLRVFYIAPLSELTDKTQSIDSTAIPERFQSCLAYKVAVYLAAKDGRDDDQARFQAEADRMMGRYTGWLRQHLSMEQRLWVPGLRIPSPVAGTA